MSCLTERQDKRQWNPMSNRVRDRVLDTEVANQRSASLPKIGNRKNVPETVPTTKEPVSLYANQPSKKTFKQWTATIAMRTGNSCSGMAFPIFAVKMCARGRIWNWGVRLSFHFPAAKSKAHALSV